MFQLFLMNLEVWGSFSPMNPKLFDLQMARTMAYTKLVKVRKQIDELCSGYAKEKGKIMKEIVMSLNIINFYFQKIEIFLAKKHESAF